ncbi:4Fe-4S binding protein [Thermosulfuriphilus sp.]
MDRLRLRVQLLMSLLANAYFGFLSTGTIYLGRLKGICFPGLNCYSCPAALWACPLGSLQGFASEIRAYGLSRPGFYVLGTILLYGLLFGRFVCGWLCPFGLIQELLWRFPGRKFSLPRSVSYGKYVVLLLFVFLLPALITDRFGFGQVWFCKYICPAGTIEAGIPHALWKAEIRQMLGLLFLNKVVVAVLIIMGSIFFFRPFCQGICPLGALYGLIQRHGLLRLSWQEKDCLSCGICSRICPMGLKIPEELDSPDCIRCLRCLEACPTKVIKIAPPPRGPKEGHGRP